MLVCVSVTAREWTVPSWKTALKKHWRAAPAVLHAGKKGAHVRVTSTMTASMLDSRMARCLRETLTLLTMAAQSVPAPLEGAASAATSSAVRTCHQTALRFWSLQTVACSVNAWDVFMMVKSMRLDTPSTLTHARSAIAPMKEVR